PTPKLIATYETEGEALAISKGIDRDRAVDESGNQLSVFNRRGARPFNLQEMQRMYLRDGKLWTISDDVPPRPRRPQPNAAWMKLSDFAAPGMLPVYLVLMMLVGGVRYARRRE